MLLWIAKGCVMPGQRSTSHCKYCAEEDHLISCQLCMEWLCPNHRWGTGSLNDGYYCLGGHADDPRIPKAAEIEPAYSDLSLWNKFKFAIKMDPFLAWICLSAALAAALAATLAVTLATIQITLAIMGQPNWPNHR